MNERLDEHLGYVCDSRRSERFRAAVTATVKPGSIVADLGCGTGILGLECLKAGAGHVFAVDETEMINVAREAFERAGMADRTTCIRGRSFRIELPERVDVAICDHVGFWGFDYGIIDLLADARLRFLKPDGVMVPRRLRLMLGAVQSSPARRPAEAWHADGVPCEYHWLSERTINSKHAVRLGSGDLIAAPCALGDIVLGSEGAPFLSWSCEMTAERAGALDGLAGWFECELADGVWMTNSPLAQDAINREQAFLPIGEPAELVAGESIRATVMIRPADHVIAWTVTLPASGRRFSHSTFEGALLGPDALGRGRKGSAPRLNKSGRARAVVLGYCDGQRTAKEIEAIMLRDHPDLLPSQQEVARFVAETLSRDTN